MRVWLHLLKARILLFCSLGVVLVGLAPLAYAIGLVAWQIDSYYNTSSWISLPAGLAFVDRASLQAGNLAPVLAFIPHLDSPLTTHAVVWRILSNLHLGLIPGLVGCGILAVGISSALRQRALIRIHKARRKAPVQRLEPQRREASPPPPADNGRREPFIGAGDVAANSERRAA